ncbi:MAG: DUF2709 domain-containing protein [Chlamydiales bacterium]
MATKIVTDSLVELLEKFLKKNKKADLLTTYFFFLEKKFKLHPVVFGREKKIYQSADELLAKLEKEGKVWRETQIKIQYGQQSVNAETKRIYICPFTGKVFGDNTHPNPQDAIYDWVSTCPENTEMDKGMKVKRFHISEDPDVIKNYIQKEKAAITKTVYSSAITGKLFNTKKAVIDDFKKSQIKAIDLIDVPSQNRFEIEEDFMAFLQKQLDESQISAFVEDLGKHKIFEEYVSSWLEE